MVNIDGEMAESHARVGSDPPLSMDPSTRFEDAFGTGTLVAPDAPAKASGKGPALHIPSLDGIRAFSFLFVFVGHAGYGHIVPGGFGVTVFFFLSGYLITTLLRREQASSGRISYPNFLRRRFLRIAPSYLVVLAAAVFLAATGALAADLTAGSLLSQLLLFNNYWQVGNGLVGSAPGTGVFWSISVEEHFYLIFPLVFGWLTLKFRSEWSRAAVIAAVCGVILAWRCVLVLGMGADPLRTYVATDTRADSILFGVLLGLALNPAWGPTVAWKRLRWFVAAALVALALTMVPRSDVFRETVRYSLQGVALLPLFLAAVAYATNPLFRWLNLPWLKWMGRLSYGAYLVHFIVLELTWAYLPLPTPVAAAVALAVTFVLAECLYRSLDVPIMKMRARYR